MYRIQQRAADYIQSFPAFGTTEFLSLSVCLSVWVVMFYIYIYIIWHFQGKGEIFSLVLHVKQNKVWIGSTWRSALDFYSKMFMLDGFLFHSPAYCSAYILHLFLVVVVFFSFDSWELCYKCCISVKHKRIDEDDDSLVVVLIQHIYSSTSYRDDDGVFFSIMKKRASDSLDSPSFQLWLLWFVAATSSTTI
jgi:hypothetical protein